LVRPILGKTPSSLFIRQSISLHFQVSEYIFWGKSMPSFILYGFICNSVMWFGSLHLVSSSLMKYTIIGTA
jgi:hypothetical protein